MPHVLGQLEEGKAIGGIERDPAGLYTWKYVGRLLSYGILASLLLAPFGAWRLLRGTPSRLAGPMLAGWFSVFALFYLVGMRLDMVDKEMWFALPAVAICAGVACDRLLQRFPRQALSRALVTVYLSYLASGGAVLWLLRIMYTRH